MSAARPGSFPWSTALKIAARETRSAAPKFVFVMLAVAVGVGTLTGVRAFSHAFGSMLVVQARSLMAGDVTVRLQAVPTPEQLQQLASLEQRHVRSTLVTETASMVSGPAGDPVLASVKAVDPAAYPYSGTVGTTPTGLSSQLDDQNALVSSDLLLRLGIQPGGSLTLGGQSFRVLGQLDSEPDRLEGMFSLGPPLLVTRGGLARTGIVQFGSLVQNRLLLSLAPGAPPIAGVEAELRRDFPRSRVLDYREANPTLQQGLDRSTTFLSLISLMALIIGALGVASAMHAHLQLRMDAIATMKVLGARASQIVRIYGVQTLLLGLAGGVVGIGLSGLIQTAFPRLLQHLLPGLPPIGWAWGPAGEGLAIGVLITLLFTLPALLSVRRVRPALIYRRYMHDAGADADGRWKGRILRWLEIGGVALVLFAGLALIAAGLVDATWAEAWRIGQFFLLALAVGTLFMAATTWLLLRLLRGLASAWKQAGRLPPALRHGLANVYRPGSQAQPVMIALGIGVMFTLSVFLLQRSLLTDIVRNAPPGVPNLMLVDIPPDQAQPLEALLRKQPGLTHPPELLPTTTARLESVNGVAPAPPGRRGGAGASGEEGRGGEGRGAEGRGGRFRGFTLATSAPQPDSLTLDSGTWWAAKPTEPQIAAASDIADALHLHLGDRLVWTAGDKNFTAHLAAIYVPDPHRLMARVQFIVSPGPLDGLPMIVNGGVHLERAAIPALERELYTQFPTVTVIDLADLIGRLQDVVNQISAVVHFVSLFAILAGAIILAAGVAGTRFRRMREIAVLKTCGATRGRVARIFSTEFFLLGGVAGLAGSLLAVGFTNLLTSRLLHVPFHVDWLPNLTAVAATATVAVAAGWLACARILTLRPLDVLRGE